VVLEIRNLIIMNVVTQQASHLLLILPICLVVVDALGSSFCLIYIDFYNKSSGGSLRSGSGALLFWAYRGSFLPISLLSFLGSSPLFL
jgi:hypothetical protein